MGGGIEDDGDQGKGFIKKEGQDQVMGNSGLKTDLKGKEIHSTSHFQHYEAVQPSPIGQAQSTYKALH